MSGSEESWGGRGGKRATPTAEASKDAELKTTKGVPASASARARGVENPGSDQT